VSEQEDDLKVYAIRFTDTARSDIDYASDRFAAYAGNDVADEWEDGLEEAISHLATGPHRPLAVESALFEVEVRYLTYQRHRSRAAYRVLFTVREETPDGPQVIVFHVRHASARPLQSYEVRNLKADLEDTN
jgi:plasmid stabilization system protein ParE